nr:helix-turn-helix transcriptional regulator [Bacteroidota bacterium]
MIGNNIKRIMQHKGWSVNDLADDLGMTVQSLYRIFKKDSIESKHLVRIAEIFDIPIGTLFSDMLDKTYPYKSNKELEKELDEQAAEYHRVLKSNYDQIKYLEDQLSFYKEQAETFKILNQQLRETIKQGSLDQSPPEKDS